MVGREGSLQTYPEIGVPDSHHPLTHHRGTAELVEQVTLVNTFHVELFSHLVAAVSRRSPRAMGRCSTTMVVYGSAIRTATAIRTRTCRCSWSAAPTAGSTAAVTGSTPSTPMTNLFLTLLDRMGVSPSQSATARAD